MVLHRPATWVDPVLNVVAGRTATSWAICVTLTADLSGPVAALHNSTISSSQSKYFISSRFWVLIFNQLFHCSGETATCLFNSPHEDAVLPRVLPGKLLSLDAQCRMDRGTSACFVSAKWYFFLHTKCQSFKPFAFFFPFFFKLQKDDRVCAQLFCFDASSGYCVSYRPAAEGSICGDGQVNTVF